MQIGKFELLQWAAPLNTTPQKWSDINPHMYYKINFLFKTSFSPLSTSEDYKLFFYSRQVPEILDWDAIEQGRGRAIFNFLAFLYVIESIKDGNTAPIEFALPVDQKITDYLESPDVLKLLQIQIMSPQVQISSSHQKSISISQTDVKLDNFLTEMDSLVPNLDESIRDKALLASRVLQRAVEHDLDKEYLDQDCQTDISYRDLSNIIMKTQQNTNDSVYTELLQENMALKQQNKNYEKLVDFYRSQTHDKLNYNQQFYQTISQLQKQSISLDLIQELQIETLANVKVQKIIYENILKIKSALQNEGLNMYQKYEIFIQKEQLEQSQVSETQQIVDSFSQLSQQVQLFNTNIQDNIEKMVDLTKHVDISIDQKLEGLCQENKLLQNTISILDKDNTQLKQLNAQLITNTNEDIMKDLQTVLINSSGIELTASLIQLTQKFQYYIHKFSFVQDSYTKKLKTLNLINLDKEDMQIIQQSLDQEPEVLFQNYELQFSDKFKDILQTLGINCTYFTSSPIQFDNIPLNQTINIIKQIESDGILLKEESLQLQSSTYKNQIEQLILIISQILKQFTKFKTEFKNKHQSLVKTCRNLQMQLVNRSEETSQMFTQKLTTTITQLNINKDELEFYKQKITSQQQQITQLIQSQSLSEQAQLEAKRLWQRVKQQTQCLDLFQDVTDQLLSNNTFNIQQKLQDINAIRNQTIQFAEKSVFQCESLLAIERNRADLEREKSSGLRNQIASLKSEILVLEELLQMTKQDCNKSIAICFQEE
ncbi:hypothetical protein SS50377_22082 [Spironucleus salmonicida]|uniref:Uncharacterized protein n=1 Tax=Spironucleus salmonicida TaxID=348837 RepID=V6LM95_9EUKA|nr:hypothetical protein SS50377_22082 [Spironucleus salmonicida]|eukprot:EST45755.1 Hypothetical protein SS50377_14326 [Spironucleus salmonicida]